MNRIGSSAAIGRAIARLCAAALLVALSIGLLGASASASTAMHSTPSIQKELFGTTPDNIDVFRYTLTNDRGMRVKIITC